MMLLIMPETGLLEAGPTVGYQVALETEFLSATYEKESIDL